MYISANIFRVIGRFMYTVGESRNVYRVLVGNSKGKRTLGRSRHL